jgi:hypothetical protein
VTAVGAGASVTGTGGAVAVDGGGTLTVVDVLTEIGAPAVASDPLATSRGASGTSSAAATGGHAAHTSATTSAIRNPIRFRLAGARTGRR